MGTDQEIPFTLKIASLSVIGQRDRKFRIMKCSHKCQLSLLGESDTISFQDAFESVVCEWRFELHISIRWKKGHLTGWTIARHPASCIGRSRSDGDILQDRQLPTRFAVHLPKQVAGRLAPSAAMFSPTTTRSSL